MFDIKKIRENPVDFDNNLSKRKHEPISIKILDLDKENRDLIGLAQTGTGKTCLLYTSPSPRD